MLAETVQQANHVVSLPTGPSIKTAESATKNAPAIIRPEMANTAICPDTILIHKYDVPKGRKVTYGSFVVGIKEYKEEKEYTIFTVGGDQIE
jgi:hypothetical protein